MDVAARQTRDRGGVTQGKHILVVDDQPDICEMIEDYLLDEGYRVSTAHDGQQMRRVLAETPADLVILDLMLPGEDGLTLARYLREETEAAILMLTARS